MSITLEAGGTPVSDPRQAEEILPSEQMYRMILDNLPQKVFAKDRDSGYLLCNKAYADGMGIRPAEFTGKNDFAFFPKELAEKYRADDQSVMAGGTTVTITERYVEKEEEFYVQTVKAPLKDASGEVAGILGIFWDVTEQVRAEQARRRAEEEISRLAAIVESSEDAIVGKTLEGVITSWNRGAEHLYGYRADEVVGKPIAVIVPPDRQEELPSILAELERGKRVQHYETARVRKDGATVDVSVSMSPLRDAAGQVVGAASIARDITEQKRAEAERERLLAQVQRQAQEILDISTPVVQVWDGVVAVPLIGTLDSQRTQQVTEHLLEWIVTTRSSVALLDITGVPAIDTQTARHLIETIAAVRLLGAQVVLTGIRPAIAQTLVHLGIDLSGVVTRSSLAAGLRVALDLLGLQMTNKGVQ